MKALDHGPALLLFGTTGLLAGMPGLDIRISLALLCWHWRGMDDFLMVLGFNRETVLANLVCSLGERLGIVTREIIRTSER